MHGTSDAGAQSHQKSIKSVEGVLNQASSVRSDLRGQGAL